MNHFHHLHRKVEIHFYDPEQSHGTAGAKGGGESFSKRPHAQNRSAIPPSPPAIHETNHTHDQQTRSHAQSPPLSRHDRERRRARRAIRRTAQRLGRKRLCERRPGVGGFLWQEYNANHYAQIILCILTIGVVGLVLDRLMSLIEARFKSV